MKDPAVLFYTQDFLTGTMLMSDAQKGKYITLLCLQHQNGKLSERDMLKICGEYDADIWAKFYAEDGFFYNKRMLLETAKRNKFCEHQKENISKRWNKKEYHGNTTVIPLENENVNENEIVIINQLKVQFEIFREMYPGTKRGSDVEFSNLTKKHRDWKEIIPTLSDRLSYQMACREEKKQAGGFVPEWKNLQTWINQRSWEEEIAINNVRHGTDKKNNGATSEEVLGAVNRYFPIEGYPEQR